MTETSPAPPIASGPRQRPVVLAGLAGLAALALAAGQGGARLGGAAVLGAAAGMALYHARFGFTSAWRRFADERRGRGVRAQMLLFALACAASYPLIAGGGAGGFVAPFGIGSAVGAFAFGVGMQFGGSCASGTLYTSGGGSSRMLVTLGFFVLGSGLGTWRLEWWAGLPHFAPVSYLAALGVPGALALTLGVLGAIAVGTAIVERRAHGGLERESGEWRLLGGPWPQAGGAVALAVVSVAVLVVLNRPWGITSGFALWGAKGLAAVGVPVESWDYWAGARRASLTERSVLADATSVMNLGIMLGALTAAGLAGRFRPALRIAPGALATAVAGGLMMGWGARLAYGCNIGAYLGGVVSGSLHGWWWLIFGFAGSVAGSRAKARLGL